MIGPTNAQTPEELTQLALSVAREKLNQAQMQADEVRASLKEPYALDASSFPEIRHELPPVLNLDGLMNPDPTYSFDAILARMEHLFQPKEDEQVQAFFDSMRAALLPTTAAMVRALQRCKRFLQGELPLDDGMVGAIQERASNRIEQIGGFDAGYLRGLYTNNKWPLPVGAMQAALGEIAQTTQEQKADFNRAFVAAKWSAVQSGLNGGIQAMLSAMRDALSAAIEIARLRLDNDPSKDALSLERTKLGVMQRLAQAQLAFNRSQVELAETQLMIPLAEIDDASGIHTSEAKMRLSLWRAQVDLAADKVRGLSNISSAQINGSSAGASIDADVSIV